MTGRLWTILALVLMSGLVSGCNPEVTKYVNGASRPMPRGPAQVPGPIDLKITSGKLNSNTTNGGAVTGSITPTNRLLSLGPDMAIEVSINGSRLKQ